MVEEILLSSVHSGRQHLLSALHHRADPLAALISTLYPAVVAVSVDVVALVQFERLPRLASACSIWCTWRHIVTIRMASEYLSPSAAQDALRLSIQIVVPSSLCPARHS